MLLQMGQIDLHLHARKGHLHKVLQTGVAFMAQQGFPDKHFLMRNITAHWCHAQPHLRTGHFPFHCYSFIIDLPSQQTRCWCAADLSSVIAWQSWIYSCEENCWSCFAIGLFHPDCSCSTVSMLHLWVVSWTWLKLWILSGHGGATTDIGHLVTYPECLHLWRLSDNHLKCQLYIKGCSRRSPCDFCVDCTADQWAEKAIARLAAAKRHGHEKKRKDKLSSFTRQAQGCFSRAWCWVQRVSSPWRWDGWVTTWPVSSHKPYEPSRTDQAFPQGTLSIGYSMGGAHL